MLSLLVMGKRRADPGCGQLSIAERVGGGNAVVAVVGNIFEQN